MATIQRVTGLASGMDYESIVEKLMTAESAKLNKYKQTKQIYEWQQEIYRDVNTSLSSLKTSAYNLKLSSAYNAYTAESDDTSVVTATATSSAEAGTYSVKVTQLATTTQKSATSISAALESSAEITDFDVSGKDFTVTFDGTEKTLSWSSSEGSYTTLAELQAGLQDKIDDAFGENQVTVSTTTSNGIQFEAANSVYKSNIIVGSGTTDDALVQLNFSDGDQSQIDLDTDLEDLKFANGSLTFDTDGNLNFTINGSNFSVAKTDSLQTLITTVNNDEDADVIMAYDSDKDVLTIKRKSSGAGKDITLTDGDGGNFSTAVGFDATVAGKNAIFSYIDNDGVETDNIEKASNTVTLDGVTFKLLKADDTEFKSITVSQNVDDVYDKIESFVTQYNETIDKINTLVEEDRDYDYQPLTSDQEEEMTDEEIETWNTKAKAGLLSKDSALEGIVREMRYALSSIVSGADSEYNQLSEFGITTSSDYSENGKLEIDEDTFKGMISENPNAVYEFFAGAASNLKGDSLSGTVDVDSKSFKVAINGITQEVTLSGSYDLSTSSGKTSFISGINSQLNDTLGTNQLIATLDSNNKIVFSSPKGYSFTLNSGTTSDALSVLGFSDGDEYDNSDQGIIPQIYNKLTTAISSLVTKSGLSTATTTSDSSTIGTWISDLEEKIDEEQERLDDVETRYYKQFTAMESYISKMNSQSSWLSQYTSSSSS